LDGLRGKILLVVPVRCDRQLPQRHRLDYIAMRAGELFRVDAKIMVGLAVTILELVILHESVCSGEEQQVYAEAVNRPDASRVAGNIRWQKTTAEQEHTESGSNRSMAQLSKGG
jgi:hypothetical protein